MKIKIIGSGGCVSLPRPLCQCNVCKEARLKGTPYSRCGCSLLIEDVGVLIDTPEDINYALNKADVKMVNYILYSHMDPDHTMGMRVIEQLRLDWLKNSVGILCDNPIKVISLPKIVEDLKHQGTKYGSALDYYESKGLVKVVGQKHIDIGSIHIELVPANEDDSVTIFVITDGVRKVIYAPCDVKPFPKNKLFCGADCLIIGNTIIGEVLKDGFILEKENPLREELFVMDEIIELKNRYNFEKVIITHIEEDWGKSYDDYLELQKQYNESTIERNILFAGNILFAYDGMEV